jgi:hypothetical protein
MRRTVTLKVGQFLLLVVAILMIGVSTGVMAAGWRWHVHGAVALAAPIQIAGLAAFIVMSIWKSVDDWTAKTSGKPWGF